MGGFIAPRRPTSSLGITRGKGRSAMNVTGPQGLGNESLTVNKKTLLGG